MPLATLAQVKAKLGIDASDTSEDTPLLDVLGAAEAYILERTGFTLAAGSFTEYMFAWLPGRAIRLKHRPVATAVAETRAVGVLTWSERTIDILDPDEGLVVVPGIDWMAAETVFPFWLLRDSETTLRIRYTTGAWTPTADISDACAVLAAAWYTQGKSAGLESAKIGNVQEWYARQPVPPHVSAVLARYERGRVTWW